MSNNATANSAAASAGNNGGPGAKKVISRQEWDTRLSSVPVQKKQLNQLVMNYLIIQGYKDAAEKFAAEASLQPHVDLSTIEDRMTIRQAVESGRIDEAIEKVNDLDPEVGLFLYQRCIYSVRVSIFLKKTRLLLK
jgi:hypothetical protein